MTCPNCKQPLQGGLFMCQRCEKSADGELGWIAMCGVTVRLPVPSYCEVVKGHLIATWRKDTYLVHREQILKYQTSAVFDSLSATYRVWLKPFTITEV